jgi:Ras-related protein Rab-2A
MKESEYVKEFEFIKEHEHARESINMKEQGNMREKTHIRKKEKVVKIVIGGDGAVGKSSLIQRLLGDLESKEPCMTPGLEIRDLKISGDILTSAVLWDLGGQKQFRFFQGDFFKGAKIVIIVYSVEWLHSFINLDCWLSLIPKNKPPIKIYLLANKVDTDKRAITREEGLEFARGHNMAYYEISATTGDGLEAFEKDLIETIKHIDLIHIRMEKVAHLNAHHNCDINASPSDDNEAEKNNEPFRRGQNYCIHNF